MGCGCGAISLSILKVNIIIIIGMKNYNTIDQERPNSSGVAVDVSYSALKLTVNNFHKVFGKDAKMEDKLDVIHASWKKFADDNVQKFDIILSNPPYIPTPDLEKLEKQV